VSDWNTTIQQNMDVLLPTKTIPLPSELVEIDYTNWRGERRKRQIIPTGRMEFANTEWHPDTQWLIEATDVEDGKLKDFAMKDIHSWQPVSSTSSASGTTDTGTP
jgi:uncharacterized protein (DUF1684 family)